MIALTPAISNDIASDLQHSAATIQQRAVELTDYVANPIQTWINTFEAAGINLQSLAAQYAQHPFPVPQQMAANFLQYGVQYVTPYTQVANSAVNFFLGTGTNDLVPLLQAAAVAASAGQISTAVLDVYNAVFGKPILDFGAPLETIPQILNPITQNLANTSSYLTTTALQNVGAVVTINLPQSLEQTLGTSLQNVYNSFAAGDPVGGLINAVDIPGALTNTFLNGLPQANGTYSEGLLSAGQYGLVKAIGITTAQGLAQKIVAPKAQNIMTGGSLSYALGQLLNLVTTGFPTPQTIVNNAVNLLQYLFANPSGAAAGAVNVGNFAALAPAASALPGLSAGVLKAFDPAAVTNIAASLGPSLAAEVAGSLGANLAGSLATTLSVDLSKAALHILSAL
ncbi:hypothetical protein H7H82_17500 [Mycobacterium heidelbergense]|uniref:Uncharacterized protein n=1 Tax=Mycobacterium heidelbergense TaxID=53376 RepID=A0A1X0D2F3_MYCHE|nr:hypothetical protein [Mycobacterium heidelbergense]MCV7052363.1 hypothetical protein [Mycobacterium heidelbergense]ORA66594.1 hypothetical protein BST25_23115 [Mycobacterium heidelbergense]